ncbi:hypothetical protein Tco_0123228 [Tanacetum coccineum]
MDKDHPLDKIIGDPSRPISTSLQLQTEAPFCYYDALLSSIEHKGYKDALTESCWFDAMKSFMMILLKHYLYTLEERLDKHGSRLYRLENQDIPNQVSKVVDEIVTDVVDWAMHAPLRERFRDLPEADMKEILHNQMWESKSYQTHEDHMSLYEALEKSMARDNRDHLLSDLAEARKKKKKRQGSPKMPSNSPPHPPPPPPPAGPSGTSGASGASGSSNTAALAEYTAWTMTDTRIKLSILPIPEELHMGDDSTADDPAYSSSGEDVGRDHIPTVKLS